MKHFMGLFAVVVLLAGCVTKNVPPDPDILRVGITPDAQPIAFKQGGQIVGIEADFAKKLGKALNRKIVFIEISWEKQIDYLEQNKTDIIMSGMSITAARSMRINFTSPYMQSGLTALFRRDSFDPSGLLASTIMNQTKRIGSVKDTTGNIYVVERFSRAEKKTYSDAEAGAAALKDGKIDMFIHDAPVVWWLSALNESDLVAFPDVLNIEPLAWGLRKSDMDLLDQINTLIAEWSKDGSGKRIIQNWIPIFGQQPL